MWGGRLCHGTMDSPSLDITVVHIGLLLYNQRWKNLGFLEKFLGFLGFLDFSVQRQPDKNLPSRKNILDPFNHSPVTLFSTNYNKTQKFRLKCENKYIIFEKVGQK